MEKKICSGSGCGESKPATSEYFYRNKSNKDGFTYKCKDCIDASRKGRKFATGKYTRLRLFQAFYEKHKVTLSVRDQYMNQGE